MPGVADHPRPLCTFGPEWAGWNAFRASLADRAMRSERPSGRSIRTMMGKAPPPVHTVVKGRIRVPLRMALRPLRSERRPRRAPSPSRRAPWTLAAPEPNAARESYIERTNHAKAHEVALQRPQRPSPRPEPEPPVGGCGHTSLHRGPAEPGQDPPPGGTVPGQRRFIARPYCAIPL